MNNLITVAQAVELYNQKRMLLILQFGSEDATDIGPQGWFESWYAILVELSTNLELAGLDPDSWEYSKIAQELDITNWLAEGLAQDYNP